MFKAVLGCILAVVGTATQAQLPEVTLHSTSRLVVVDVIVSSPDGQPVTGLKQADFTVYENGKPQPIRSFEAHTPESDAAQERATPPAPPLGPDEYSNVPRTAVPGSLNIVLLDTLNTPLLDQSQARRHMLEFLKQMPRGQHMAVFTLTASRVHMIQNVTGDSAALIAAVDKLLISKSMLLKADEERAEDLTILNSIAVFDAKKAQSIADFFGTVEKIQTEERIQITLHALQSIARAVAGYPGRKNLVWISGGFPISFDPGDRYGGRYFGGISFPENFTSLVRETASLLASSQVAIYPVDARGLVTFSPPADLPRGTARAVTSINADSNLDILGVMKELADLSGGKAFYNGNDLKAAIAQSISLGSSYYTLAYAPSHPKWDGSFKKLKVDVARAKVNLMYRRGYYALSDDAVPDKAALKEDIVLSMMPINAESTAILLSATVTPNPSDGKVHVLYSVGPGQISSRDSQGHARDLQIEFVVAGWDDKGHNTGDVAHMVRIGAGSHAADEIERNGLAKKEELAVKPGTTHLRIGVIDHNTGKIGTLDVPLAPAAHGGD